MAAIWLDHGKPELGCNKGIMTTLAYSLTNKYLVGERPVGLSAIEIGIPRIECFLDCGNRFDLVCRPIPLGHAHAAETKTDVRQNCHIGPFGRLLF